MFRKGYPALLAGLGALLGGAVSATAAPTAAECRQMPAKSIPAEVLNNGFLDAHPDMRWRSVALGQYRDGDFTAALESFKKAAYYADKFSQSMVARMYWNGEGTGIDRALGYAWMDVAAERMYHDFLRSRELYWSALDHVEQTDALARGKAVFAEYSDESAKPRMNAALEQGLRQVTGSRLGVVNPGLVVTPKGGEFSGIALPASAVYDKAWWSPDEYWCTQDAYWARPLNPNVDVGLPESVAPGGVK